MIAAIPITIPIAEKTYELISNGLADSSSPFEAEHWPTTLKIIKIVFIKITNSCLLFCIKINVIKGCT